MQVSISMAKAHARIRRNKVSKRDNTLDGAFISEQVGLPVEETLPTKKGLMLLSLCH